MTKLNLNHNHSLNQRVIMKYQLSPLNKTEVKEYVDHQLKLAGANHPIFIPEALETIVLRSRALPRLINNIKVNPLLLGLQFKAEQINQKILFKA